jgi:hypothetical protein
MMTSKKNSDALFKEIYGEDFLGGDDVNKNHLLAFKIITKETNLGQKKILSIDKNKLTKQLDNLLLFINRHKGIGEDGLKNFVERFDRAFK